MSELVDPPRNAESGPDLDEIGARLDALRLRADKRLESLVSDEQFRALKKRLVGTNRPTTFRDVPFTLKLGSAQLSVAAANALDLDSIVPLVDAANGFVQIWTNGRLFGTGVLLVANGKLAVRIDKIEES